MAERVPEIEQRAFALLALVARDDAGLVAAAETDRLGERIVVVRVQRVGVRFEPGEEIRVADRAVLDDFGKTRRVFALRERRERRRVDEDRARLMERADEVLAGRDVD